MGRRFTLLSYIFMSTAIFAASSSEVDNVKSIVDKYSLLKDKRIELREYNIDKLKEKLAKEGYITSIPVLKNNKIEIVTGIIEKIEFEDESTNNPNLKKLLLGLNGLEGKPLNIKDIDKIIAKYNSLGSNQVKIQIIPGTKPASSIIKIVNKYKQNTKFYGIYDYDYKKEHTLTGIVTRDQILGLNDKLSLYSVVGKNDYYVATSYKIPLIITNLTTSGSYSYTKVKDVRSPKRQFSLSTENTLYQDRLTTVTLNDTLEHYNQKDYVRDLKVVDYDVNSNETNLTYNKITTVLSNPAIINYSATYKFGKVKSEDSNKFSRSLDLEADLITRNTSTTLEYFKSNSENKKFSYSSGFNSYNGLPVKIDYAKEVFLLDTSIYHTFKKDEFSVTPKLRGTLARVNKEDTLYGFGAYLEFGYKNFTIGTKIGMDKKRNKFVALQVKFIF